MECFNRGVILGNDPVAEVVLKDLMIFFPVSCELYDASVAIFGEFLLAAGALVFFY